MIEVKKAKLGGLPVHGATTTEILTNDHNAIKKLLDVLTRAEPADRSSALERLKAFRAQCCYEKAPIPKLTPGHVLIRTHAVGINPPDWYLRRRV